MYEIDENLAKRAKELNSFSDYEENSATNGYKEYLYEFERGVQDLMSAHPENLNAEAERLITYYQDRYAKKLASAINEFNRIEAMMPSILITGGGNFNCRKKQKQNNARDSFWEKNNQIFEPTNNYYFNKIKAIITNKVIYSDDAMAIEKIEAKIDNLTETQAYMKRANEWYRKHNTMVGFEDLTDEEAEKTNQCILQSWYKTPFASFELTNNNANIRRLKERLEELKQMKARNTAENGYISVDGVEVEEDTTEMRIRLKFTEIPSQEVREMLKHRGFKWSPKNEAWQRQLTANGVYATKRVLETLKGGAEC